MVRKHTLGGVGDTLVLEPVVDQSQRALYDHLPRAYPLQPDSTVIGRGDAAHVRVDSVVVPQSVSRKHFVILKSDSPSSSAPYTVQACQPRNNVAVNSCKLKDNQVIPLKFGDRIQVCEYVFRVQAGANTAEAYSPELVEEELLGKGDRTLEFHYDGSLPLLPAQKAPPHKSLQHVACLNNNMAQSPKVAANMRKFKWKPGMMVEVLSLEEGFRGAWFTAVIRSIKKHKAEVEYPCFKQDDKGDQNLKEWVEFFYHLPGATKGVLAAHPRIRPAPPPLPPPHLALNEKVDAPYEDGWWEGTVLSMDYSIPARVVVEFSTAPDGEGGKMPFTADELRPSVVWAGTKAWFAKGMLTDEPLVYAEPEMYSSKRFKGTGVTQGPAKRRK